jgi:N-acetylneuraminic acid mutarotase
VFLFWRQVEIYDPRANAWRKARAMGGPRAYGAATAVDGHVYALGGMRSHVRAHAPLCWKVAPLGSCDAS